MLSAAIVAALFASTSTNVAAQEAETSDTQTDAQTMDRITVTGSRIARQGFVTPSPVTAISAEDIRATGAVTIGDLMNELPALATTYSLGNSSRFIGTVGLGLLDLRGMGTNRTLVLVNGRRHVGSSPGSTDVDVNTIPVEWIERVEVITGGASSVYGADAVAGVVNFILRKSFDGMEMRGQYGKAGEGGFDRGFLTLSGGSDFADGRGTAAFSVEYSTQDRFKRSDRKIGQLQYISAANPDYDPTQPSTQSNPQRILVGPGGIAGYGLFGGRFTAGGIPYIFENDGSFRPQNLGTVDGGNCYNGCDFLDLNAVEDLQPAYNRASFNANFTFDLNENHRLFSESKYSQNRADYRSQPAFDSNIRIQRDNAFLTPELGALMDANGLTSIGINRFHVDAGQRGEEVERQTFRQVLGLEGFLGENWSYEVSGVYGQTTVDRISIDNRINDRFFSGIDAVIDPVTGNPVCRATIDPTARDRFGDAYPYFAVDGCEPVNIMGYGLISQDAKDWFNAQSLNQSKLTQTVFSASLSNSALFELPAGGVGFAGGLEYRKETSRENTDALSAAGLTFLNAIPSESGSYSVKEIFAETSVPLLADLPGVERLTWDLSGRYSDYSSVGNVGSWGTGLDWQVVPSLRVRATLARAVRAPNIAELYGPLSENFANGFLDPCDSRPGRGVTLGDDPALRAANCAALGIPADYVDNTSQGRPGVSGGNPDVAQERAKTVSYGIVWQPEFVDNLGISLDYWRIDLTDSIGSLSAQILANRCVDSPGGIDNIYCSAIARAGATEEVDGDGRTWAPYNVLAWRSVSQNLGRLRRQGVDAEIDYRWNMGDSQAVVRFVGTRLLQYRSWNFQEEPDKWVESVTTAGSPRWRATLNANWSLNDWRASWTTRYIGPTLRATLVNANNNPGQLRPLRNGSYVYHDLQAGYRFGDSGWDTYVGIDNAFDKDPPPQYFGRAASDALYDNLGRFMYVGATYRF